MPAGTYPKTVTWPQGKVQVTKNLYTGAVKYRARSTAAKVSPKEGVRVLPTVRGHPPPPQEFAMGIVTARVTRKQLTFRRRSRL